MKILKECYLKDVRIMGGDICIDKTLYSELTVELSGMHFTWNCSISKTVDWMRYEQLKNDRQDFEELKDRHKLLARGSIEAQLWQRLDRRNPLQLP